MTDKWVQKLTQLAGEYQQESANGKPNKGKFIQKAMKMANEMTDDLETDEEKKKKNKEMIEMAEGFAGKIYGFDPKANQNHDEGTKPSKPPKKNPPGKPSYLIPKKETKETKKDQDGKESGDDSDPDPTEDKELEQKYDSETSSQQNTTKTKPKKRPPGGKPSYLIPKKENESPPSDEETKTESDKDKDKLKEQEKEVRKNENEERAIETQEKTKLTDEEARSRKKAELETRIEKEEAEIDRLEQLVKKRSEARAKLEAKVEIKEVNSGGNETNDVLKTGVAVSAGIAATAGATTAAVIALNQKSKTGSNGDNDANTKTREETKSSNSSNLSQEISSLPPVDCPSPSAPPASEDTDYYSVVVPQGVRSGTNFKVEVGGKYFEVTCPPNIDAGQQIRVELPKPERKTMTSKSPKKNIDESVIHVVVPKGISAGMPFRVAVGTTQFTVTCPPNASAGQKIAVKVPVDSRGRSKSPKPPSSSQPKEHYVYIPPNIHPGMAFIANVHGQIFKVTCPPSTKPGMRIKVIPPSAGGLHSSRARTPPRATTHKEHFDVIVPSGVLPGHKFKIMAKGQEYLVTCPPNVVTGQTIRVPVIANSNISDGYNNGLRQTSLSPVRLHNNLQPYV